MLGIQFWEIQRPCIDICMPHWSCSFCTPFKAKAAQSSFAGKLTYIFKTPNLVSGVEIIPSQNDPTLEGIF